MREEILKYLNSEIEKKRNARKAPLVVLYNQVKTKFGVDCVKHLKELKADGLIFGGHTMNSFWISTLPQNEICKL
jgi:hypothetical protein